jgi:hypothetical protein
MAFYTSSIKTHYYEPTVFSAKNRAEFRLDSDKLFLSNMRLLQVSNNSINNATYKKGCGVLQTIRTLELLDGSKTLCRLDNVDSLYNFKRVNNSNDENLIKSRLDRTKLGYIYTPADLTTVNAQITSLDLSDALLYDTVEGYIDLNDLLPFLKASQIVPTQVFKNLKLALTYYNGGEPDWTGATPPLLAVDEMLNTDVADAMLKSYKGFIWTEMERDQYVVPAISQTDLVDKEVRVQSVRNQLKGFDNKMVKRCFIQKQTPGDFYSDFGLQGSAPQNRERLQVRKNGSNIYAGNGLDSPALIQNEVVQIWGEMNKTLLGVFQPDVIDQGLLGDYYMAFDLTGNRTNELQIEYQRTVLKDNADTNNNRTSLALTMNVYGEVEKVIQVNGDMTYRVMYA